MIKSETLVALADKWPIDWNPKYRTATCAGCGRNVHKMWHIWFVSALYFKELHLCKKCYKKYDGN